MEPMKYYTIQYNTMQYILVVAAAERPSSRPQLSAPMQKNIWQSDQCALVYDDDDEDLSYYYK